MAAVPVSVLCVALLLGSPQLTTGYNVDLDGWVVYRGPPRSLFGFSVAGYTDQHDSW